MNKKQIVVTGLVLLIGVGVFVFIGNKRERKPTQTSSQKKLLVTASFYPIAYLAERVGGERVEVINLTPTGVEPHDFEPTTKDIATLQQSRLLLMNGGGVEAYENKLIQLLVESSVKVVAVGTPFADGEIIKEGVFSL